MADHRAVSAPGNQGRLIINVRGESAKAIAHDSKVTLQATALPDRVTIIASVASPPRASAVTVEVQYTKREAAALALQMLDAAGYAAELRDGAHTAPPQHAGACGSKLTTAAKAAELRDATDLPRKFSPETLARAADLVRKYLARETREACPNCEGTGWAVPPHPEGECHQCHGTGHPPVALERQP